MLKLYKAMSIAILTLCVTGCAAWINVATPKVTDVIKVEDTDKKSLYSKAVQSAVLLGYALSVSDEGAGTLNANKGSGFIEATFITLVVTESDDSASITIVADSSGGGQNAIDEFKAQLNSL